MSGLPQSELEDNRGIELTFKYVHLGTQRTIHLYVLLKTPIKDLKLSLLNKINELTHSEFSAASIVKIVNPKAGELMGKDKCCLEDSSAVGEVNTVGKYNLQNYAIAGHVIIKSPAAGLMGGNIKKLTKSKKSTKSKKLTKSKDLKNL